jgi:flagellin
MDITSLSGLNTAQSTTVQRSSDKLQAIIDRAVGNTNSSLSTGDNVTSVSVAAQLQASSAGLRQISTNLAQADSLTQVAGQGTAQIQEALQQLQNLAGQADDSTLSNNDRATLDQQFQQGATQINQIAASTSFDGQPLLDGSISGNKALSLDNLLSEDGETGTSDSGALSIGGLNTNSLFGGQSLNLLSSSAAQQALITISGAIDQTVSTASGIGAFQQSVDFAAANVDSASFNQQAAMSNLSEADLAGGASHASFQSNANAAVNAQGNNLTPALLELIN